MSRLPVGTLAVFALFGVAACSSDSTAPLLLQRSASSHVSVGGAASKHFANSVKYSDAGTKPATGRSGSASMQVQAVLAKDGSTEVDASTGSLELGTTRGSFSKLLAKLSTNGDLMQVANYNGLSSGTWTSTYGALHHGDSVQLQANIRGVDGHRTDVVTVSAPVTLRPDLAVQSLRAPAQARPHELVAISATVSEINGDLGARADCVLSINGAPVDRASGIWVDAGGAVSCAFVHSFDNAGTYTVQVAATNVTPADWDMSNNSASTSITILDAGQPIASGYLSVEKLDRQWTRLFNRSGGSFGPDTHTEAGQQSFSDVYVSALNPTVDPQPQHVDAVITVDGTVTHSVTFDTPSFISDDVEASYSQHCWEYDSDGEWLSACTYSDNTGVTNTSYYYELQAGSVTYAGGEYYCSVLNVCGSYEYNVATTTGSGIAFNVGSSLQIHLSFVDINGLAHTIDQTANPVLQPLTAYPNVTLHQCGYDEFQGNYCEDDVSTGTDWLAQLSWP